MPKRSNEFQHLIAVLHQQLHEQATVEESKMLTNKLTDLESEVDVVIEETSGEYTFTIGIECVDYKRPATVEWIQRMRAKHDGLTHKLVLVSRSGFTKQSLDLGKKYGIETLSLKDAEDVDWTQIVKKIVDLEFVTYRYPVQRSYLIWNREENPPAAGEFPSTEIMYDANDNPVGTLREIVDAIFRDPDIFHRMIEAIMADQEHYALEFDTMPGTYILDPQGNKREPVAIRFQGRSQRIAQPVPLQHASFKSAQVAYGRIAGTGPMVVITERDGQPISFAINPGTP